MKIAVLCHPTLGGSGIMATELGLRLAARGHELHFVGTSPPRRWVGSENVRFHRVDPGDPAIPHVPYPLALVSTLVDVARRHGLDLVHAHYAVPYSACAMIARDVLGGRLPVVTTLHGTDVTHLGADPLHRPLVAHAVAGSDRVTVPSVFLRERAEQLGVDRGIDVIPNFVDSARYRPGRGEGRTVVHVSNFRPVKRVPEVVAVFARVPDARLVLVGDGPERPRVEADIRERGLEDRVTWLGECDPAEVIRTATVFLLPSASESFGVAALEALACGVPVVASAVGGLPEVVRHGETGFLVPPDDRDGMAAAVREVLDDPALCARLGAAARSDAVERFGADAVVDRYERLYAEVAGQ